MYKQFLTALLFLSLIASASFSQMKYSSSGYLGIGESVPLHFIHIKGTEPVLKIESINSTSPTIRFTELTNFVGVYLKYYGSTNIFSFGTHNTSNSDLSSDKDILSIKREDGRIDYYPQSTVDYAPTFVTNALSDLSKCYAVYRSGTDKFHVRGNGDIYVRGAYFSSDISFKTDVEDLNRSIELLDQLRPVKYKFLTDSKEGSSKEENYSYGLIAQEVEEILPEIVSVQDSGLKAINYISLIPMLIDAIQSQQEEIDELKTSISMENSYQKSATSSSNEYQNNVKLVARLDQNIPNPFNENTVIKYSIPVIESYAMINVYDLQGSQIRSYQIYQSGEGEITIPASELKPGIFIYNLIVDGAEVSSKRMIITE